RCKGRENLMPSNTVNQFAVELKMPANVLLEQLRSAGVNLKSVEDVVTESDKAKLLDSLRRAHGAKDGKKITVTRRETSEIRQADGSGRSRTIQVEVRKKRVFVKRDVTEARTEAADASETNEATAVVGTEQAAAPATADAQIATAAPAEAKPAPAAPSAAEPESATASQPVASQPEPAQPAAAEKAQQVQEAQKEPAAAKPPAAAAAPAVADQAAPVQTTEPAPVPGTATPAAAEAAATPAPVARTPAAADARNTGSRDQAKSEPARSEQAKPRQPDAPRAATTARKPVAGRSEAADARRDEA